MCVRLLDREAAHVDSIEVQHRKNRREAARGAASGCFEYLVDVQRLHHRVACHPAPVVEIAGDDQWRILGHQLVDAILDQGDLLLAPMPEQSKVHIDAMERVRPSGYRDFTMQQAAVLSVVLGNGLIVPAHDRILAYDGYAVMSAVVNRVLAVGKIVPD